MKNIYPHKYSRKGIADEVNTILNILVVKGRISEMEKYIQHGQITCLEHCRAVAFFSMLLAQRLKLPCNYKSLVKAALLHDYFLYDWHEKSTKHRLHGFHHPKKALENANSDYDLTPIEQDIILKHMFPLTFALPKFRESFIVCIADKWCACLEIFCRNPYGNIFNN